MSRRLLLLGVNCLHKAPLHSSASLGLRSLHCQRCLVFSSFGRHATNPHHQQGLAVRGLQQSAAEEDPSRRQRPDLLYSRVELELRAHDPAVLDSYVAFLRQAAGHLNITIGKMYEPPRHFERMSLLKSVHIFAKHKVQYETRTYFRVLELLRLTGSSADTYLEYSQRMLPEAVAMKVTRHAREPLPEHLSRRPSQPAAAEPDTPPPPPAAEPPRAASGPL